ncbi:MAG: ERAP1-like C-terminal domain-containing protein, partial [Chthoniobacterales bacterium]
LPDIPAERAVKFNVEGAGDYRVQYDEASWKLLLAELPQMSMPDRVNLLSDAWALVQANRAPLALYLDLVGRIPSHTELAEQDQIMTAFQMIDGLLRDNPVREQFQQYARSVLRPSFDKVGWDAKPNESPRMATLRASVVSTLADFNDPEIITGCHERFAKYLKDPKSLSPDLRAPVLDVIGRFADEKTWKKLHELGLKTTSIEQKQEYYVALTAPVDPKLAQATLQLALTNELPTSRALYLLPRVARNAGHADLVWQFAKAHMKDLLGKADALAMNSFAPGLFSFFSDAARIDELKAYAKANLPPESEPQVEKAADEVSFRADLKKRLVEELSNPKLLQEPRD